MELEDAVLVSVSDRDQCAIRPTVPTFKTYFLITTQSEERFLDITQTLISKSRVA